VPQKTIAELEAIERENKNSQRKLFSRQSEWRLEECLTQLMVLEKAKMAFLAQTTEALKPT